MLLSGRPSEEDGVLDRSLRPRSLDEYVGQDKVKENLRVFLRAAREREEPLDHTLLYGGPTNEAATGEALKARVAARVERIRAANPEVGDTPIPADLVTVSGSGLDPEISPAAAEYQVKRLVRTRRQALSLPVSPGVGALLGRCLGRAAELPG